MGVVGEEALEEVFGVVGLLVHRTQAVTVEQEDAAVHVVRARKGRRASLTYAGLMTSSRRLASSTRSAQVSKS